MRELKGKVAAVTGAASGLGRAMALAFADEGMHVALGDVADTSDTFAQVEKRGVSAVSMKLDVANARDVEAFAQLIDRDLGGAQVVCNNAGVSPLASACLRSPSMTVFNSAARIGCMPRSNVSAGTPWLGASGCGTRHST